MKTAIVILCLILAGCDQLSRDTPPKVASTHYQLVSDNGGNAWRLDTNTGEVKRCWQGTPGVVAPSCYTAVQK